MAAPSAEFVIWAIGGVAFRANHFQLGAAFHAELHSCGIVELAFSALHGAPARLLREEDWPNNP